MPRISITPMIRVLNPCDRADLMQFEGVMQDFVAQELAAYAVQRKNYQALQQSLEPFAIALTHVWAGKFTGHGQSERLHFLACNEQRTVFWQKAESLGAGTGHNHVYMFGQRIKLTVWLAMSHEQRTAYIR